MASPKKLSHLVLQTNRREAMIEWYCKVLGAELLFQNKLIAFISFDDEHHRVAFIDPGPLADKTAAEGKTARAGGEVGLHHVAFTYRSLDDLLRTYERLKGLGIEPYWPIHHGVTISMYYRDPDGNSVELQVDAFDTMEEAKAYMRSDSFRSNPTGVMYDPEELLRRHRAGEPLASLRQRPPLPPGKTQADMLRT